MKGNYAILFGEVVDFSWLAVSYGDKVDELKSRHQSVVHSTCEKYHGELLDFFSESTKAVFKEPLEAIKCATKLFDKFNLEPRIPYKIALCFGQIEYDSDGILGQSVETVAELVNICPEGTVLFSEAFAEIIKGEIDIQVKLIGKSFLKSFGQPVNIYCLANKGFYIPLREELIKKEDRRNSIAVLPFHNTSAERELEYICDGLAEEIIDSLTQVKELKVTARSSSFLFKNKNASILEISRKLNVNFVLDGSIRKRNNEYRISYQLVDLKTGYNILSNSISSDFDNLFNSEKRISEDILNQFDIEKTDSSANDYYINPEAYNYYLKGKHHAYQWTKETSEEAIRLYKKALDIVPDYSLAFAGLSICLMHRAVNKFMDVRQGFEQALEYANNAIEADPNRHEGYLAKALVTFWIGNWYLPDFENNLNKALQISPSNAEMRMFNGMIHLFKGEIDKAIIELKLAKSLDPYSITLIIRLGLVQYLKREYEDAYNSFLTLLDKPNYQAYSSMRLAWCCIQLKQYNKAIEFLDNTEQDHMYFNMIYSCYLVIYYFKKDDQQFFIYKNKIESQDESDVTYNYNHAILNKLLNKADKSIAYLEKTLQDNMMRFAFFQFDEFWEEYWEHPKFKSIIDNIYGFKNNVVTIESDTKECLELNMNTFLYAEAQDNYTLIAWQDKNKLAEKVLRATLASIEEQLQSKEIIRCHRSYLVNSSASFKYQKTDNKAFLSHNSSDLKIPVSRSHEKEIKEIFNKG